MNKEVDLQALQDDIDTSLLDDEEPKIKDDAVEDAPVFDLKAVLEGEVAPNLTKYLADGVITQEQITDEAKSRGWNESGEDKFGFKVTELEFLERTPQFNTIKGLKGRTERLEKQLGTLVKQNQLIAEKSVNDKKVLREKLEQAKKELLSKDYLDESDINKVKNIDTRIEETREANLISDEANTDLWDEATLNFTAENPWYGGHHGYTQAAEIFGRQYAKANKGTNFTPEDWYGNIKSKMIERYGEKLLYPDEDTLSEAPRTPKIGSNSQRQPLQRVKKELTLKDMPEEFRNVAIEVMESTGIKEEEYMKTYVGNKY